MSYNIVIWSMMLPPQKFLVHLSIYHISQRKYEPQLSIAFSFTQFFPLDLIIGITIATYVMTSLSSSMAAETTD